MSDFSVKAILSLVDENFASGFEKAQRQAQNFAKSVSEHMSGIGTSVAVAGGAITKLGFDALKSYGTLQENINKTAVIAGGTRKNMHELVDVANKMGRDLPISANQAGQAMVNMAKNGASISAIKKEFPAIARAGTAAGADLDATAEAVQQSMNIWGGSAQKNAAILVQTANASNASVETMGQAFANVGTVAKSLGISLGDTSTAIGLLTNRGMSSAQASLDLNHALTQMIKPSAAAKKLMSQLGISYVDSSGHMKSFKTILDELNASMEHKSNVDKQAYLATLFGVAGEKAMLPLMESAKDKTNSLTTSWDANVRAQQKAAGTTKQASKTLKDQANEMQKNVGSSLKKIEGSWDDLRHTSMDAQDELLSGVLNKISGALRNLQSAHTPLAKLTRDFIGLAPLIGPVVTGIGMFALSLSKIAALVNPFTLVAGGVLALSARLVAAYNNSKALRVQVQRIYDAFKGAFGTPIRNAIRAVQGLFDGLSGKSKKTGNQFTRLGDSIAKALTSMNVSGKVYQLRGVIDKLAQSFKRLLPTVKHTLKSFASMVGSSFNAVASTAKAFLKTGVIKSILTLLGNIAKLIGNVAKALSGIGTKGQRKNVNSMAKLGKDLGNAFKTAANVLNKVVTAVNNFVKRHGKLVQTIAGIVLKLGALILVVSKVYKAVKKAITITKNVISAVKTAASVAKALWTVLSANPIGATIAIIAALTSALIYFFTQTKTGRKIWKNFTSWFSKTWKNLSKTIGHVWDTILDKGFDAVDKLITWFEKLPGRMLTIGKNIITGLWNGMVDKFNKVKDGIKNMSQNMVNGFKHAFGIHSPSRVMRNEIGQFLGLGLVEGLNDTASTIQNTISGLVNTMTGAINGAKLAMPTLDTSGVTSSLDTINANASANVQGSISQRLDMVNQPAYISLGLGNRDYSAFVDDISRQQSRTSYLQLRR